MVQTILELLERMEQAPRGGARVDELSHALKTSDITSMIRRFFFLVTSPTVTFGVKALPPPATDATDTFTGQAWWSNLQPLLQDLADRKLTGNAAQDAIAQFLANCDDVGKKWTERALKQDLRLNMGAKEFNKANGEEFIPIFAVPLATDINKVKLAKVLPLSKTWALEPKLDGGRCVAFCRADGTVELLSRTGKVWGNFESIRRTLLAWNEARIAYGKGLSPQIVSDVVFDGEVVSLRPDGSIDFQALQKTMMRKDGVEVGKLHYVVFDACNLSEWFDPKFEYRLRLDDAKKLVVGTDRIILAGPSAQQPGVVQFGDNVAVVPSTTFPDGEVEANAKSLHDQYVIQGYEGLMIRAYDLPVENKRGKLLLKMKAFEDSEAIISRCVEGTGKYQGMLGALYCSWGKSTTDGPFFEIGTGFNDAQRAELWAQASQLTGEIVNFKFFEKTDAGVPRLPVYRSLRSKDDIDVGAKDDESES